VSGKLKSITASKDQKVLKKGPIGNRLQAHAAGSSGATGGMASSLAFTQIQGIELINPDLLNKELKQTKDTYFSANSGFSTVIECRKKEKTSIGAGGHNMIL
jgi:U4/U6 small nuclear ribonucleoprotein PRP31